MKKDIICLLNFFKLAYEKKNKFPLYYIVCSINFFLILLIVLAINHTMIISFTYGSDGNFQAKDIKKNVFLIIKKLDNIEKKIKENVIKSDKLLNKIKKNKMMLSNRIVCFYKLYWREKTHLPLSTEFIHDLYGQKILGYLLSNDKYISQKLVTDRRKLIATKNKLNRQKKEKIKLYSNYQNQIRMLSDERKKRLEILAKAKKKNSYIESLSMPAASIMNNEGVKKKSCIIIKEKQNVKVSEKHFTYFKKSFKMPVNGKIVSCFGESINPESKSMVYRNGIDIKADKGEPIYAVLPGRILFSRWLKGYGNMIIIDHGESYYSVYAHTKEMFKTKGQKVEEGEVIATVGDSCSKIGSKLYFEIRHHGKSMDPLLWLKKS